MRPLLETLDALPTNRVYALASQNRVREAVKLVRNEAVSDFRWNGDGTKLRARVEAKGGPFETDLRRDGEGLLATACTCSSGYDRFCTHALAVLVATLRATRNAPFYTEQDREAYLDPIRRKLGRPTSSRSSTPPAAASSRGRTPAPPAPPPSGGTIALHTIEGTGPPWLGRYAPFDERPVPVSDLPSPLLTATEPGFHRVLLDPGAFLEWVGSASDPFDVEVRRGGQKHAVRRVPARPAEVELVLQSDAKASVALSLSIRLGEEPYPGRFHPCGAGLAHALDADEIVPLADPDRAMAAIAFLQRHGAEPGATRVDCAPGNFTGIDTVEYQRIRPRLLGPDGAPCEPLAAGPGFQVEFGRAPADMPDRMQVDVRMHVAGTPLDCAARLLQAEQQFCFDRRVIELLGKRGHSQRFWERMNALLAAPTEAARSAQAAGWESMNADAGDHLLTRVLHRMHMHLAASDESLIVPGSDGAAAWVRTEAPTQSAARVIGTLRARIGVETRIGFQPRMVTPEPGLADRAAGFLAACPGAQIEVRTHGRALHMASLRIHVEAVEADDLDWFELKPEVWCGDIRIPQEQWARLIRGESPDPKSFDGVRSDSRRSLESLAAMLASTAQGPHQRVSRLHFIQWLSLREQGVTCSLPPEHANVLQALADLRELPARASPHGLKTVLRPYQQRGFEWLTFLYEHRFGACLADDMGLGKTIQTIALLGEVAQGRLRPAGRGPRELPSLVVLPPTLLFNWQHELATFHPDIDVVEYTGQNRRTQFRPGQVVLTTYEIARRDIERLEKLRFDIAVFDEAQNVKNIASARAQAMRRIRAEFTLCLTGTPVENHAGEYLAILDLAVPGLFGKPAEFRERLRRDETLLHRGRPFVLRRTKTAILDELPPKVESDIPLDLSPVQKEMYTRATAEVREEVLQAFADKSVQTAGIVALAALTRLRQICVSPAILDRSQTEPAPKFERLSETLEELLEEGHSALVFSQFVRGLDVLGEHLTTHGIAFLRMDGKTPTPRRKEIIARFQSGEGPGVFLVSLRTGGAGLNLTRASYVFHLDPWWNPAVENQASDRAHRIGQTGTVFVQRLLMRHTIEEKMMSLKARKAALFRSICEGAALDGSAGLLTKEDFRFLIDA